MTQRKWLPSEWMDELPPSLGVSPSDFIFTDEAGRHFLRRLADDRDDEEEEEGDFFFRPLSPGDVVAFCWHEPFGARVVTVGADGHWTVDAPVPEIANCFNDEEWNIHGSLDELAAERGPGRYEVDVYTWSDDELFEFGVRDGMAAFERVILQ